MAIGVITEIDEGTLDQYDQVHEKIAAGGPADGVIGHLAGAKEGGGFRIIDIYESEDAYKRFREERIGPAVTEVVGADARPAKEEVFEVHNMELPGQG